MDALPSAARMWLEPGQVTDEGQHSGSRDTTPSEGTPTQLLRGLWPRPWGTLQTCGCASRGYLGPKLKAAMSRAPECPQRPKACATTGPQPGLCFRLTLRYKPPGGRCLLLADPPWG